MAGHHPSQLNANQAFSPFYTVLVSARIEITFLLVGGMVLRLGFRRRIMLTTR